MVFENVLLIFRCETENFERKQMFMIRIFDTQYRAFDLMFSGIFFYLLCFQVQFISFRNNAISLIIEGGRNLQIKVGGPAAQGCTVPLLGEACMVWQARHQAEDQTAGFAPKQV